MTNYCEYIAEIHGIGEILKKQPSRKTCKQLIIKADTLIFIASNQCAQQSLLSGMSQTGFHFDIAHSVTCSAPYPNSPSLDRQRNWHEAPHSWLYPQAGSPISRQDSFLLLHRTRPIQNGDI